MDMPEEVDEAGDMLVEVIEFGVRNREGRQILVPKLGVA